MVPFDPFWEGFLHKAPRSCRWSPCACRKRQKIRRSTPHPLPFRGAILVEQIVLFSAHIFQRIYEPNAKAIEAPNQLALWAPWYVETDFRGDAWELRGRWRITAVTTKKTQWDWCSSTNQQTWRDKQKKWDWATRNEGRECEECEDNQPKRCLTGWLVSTTFVFPSQQIGWCSPSLPKTTILFGDVWSLGRAKPPNRLTTTLFPFRGVVSWWPGAYPFKEGTSASIAAGEGRWDSIIIGS